MKLSQMLSVKNAIERVVQGQIAVCLAAVAAGSYTREHFTEMAETVEKFIASLYISGQIDRDFSVETSMTALRTRVKFSLGGHFSEVDNMLPRELGKPQWVSRQEVVSEMPLPEITYVQFDEYQDTVAEFNQQKNLIKEQALAEEVFGLKEDPAIAAYEHAKKFTQR
jgi:hypothetical protein